MKTDWILIQLINQIEHDMLVHSPSFLANKTSFEIVSDADVKANRTYWKLPSFMCNKGHHVSLGCPVFYVISVIKHSISLSLNIRNISHFRSFGRAVHTRGDMHVHG